MLSQLANSDSVPLAHDSLVGQPYRALRLLGTGETADVFLAEHRKLGTLSVAKIEHARSTWTARARALLGRDARARRKLRDPHIVTVIDRGHTVDGRPYLVMEYLQGQTLAHELVARGKLPLHEALSYTCQLLRALAAAHARGILHGDIQPDNLFVCDGSRGSRRLKVLAFDEPRVGLGSPSKPTSSVSGVPRYVSPEGALGQRIDHRADLYASGLVLYLALTGRGPFDSIQAAERGLAAQVAEEPAPPSRFCQDIPAELDQVVLRALGKAPSERFQSADELRRAIERVASQLPQAVPGAEWRDSNAAWTMPAQGGPARGVSAAWVTSLEGRGGGPAVLRAALVAGCLLGAALGTAGALTHFAHARRAATPGRFEQRASSARAASQQSLLADVAPPAPLAEPAGSLTREAPAAPALEPVTVFAQPVSLPAKSVPAVPGASSIALMPRAAARTPAPVHSAPAKSLTPKRDGALGERAPRVSTGSGVSAGEPATHVGRRRKAIYGD